MPKMTELAWFGLAIVVTVYSIRYLRASNSSLAQTVSTIWPQSITSTSVGPTQVAA